MKKFFWFACLLILLVVSVFGQNEETLRYWDPTKKVNITVKVVFIGWEQQCSILSNEGLRTAKLLTYSSSKWTEEMGRLLSNAHTEWSEWELVNSEPKPFMDIVGLVMMKNSFIQEYRNIPIQGRQVGEMIRILSPPDTKGDPIWFDDSNGLNIFYRRYFVIN